MSRPLRIALCVFLLLLLPVVYYGTSRAEPFVVSVGDEKVSQDDLLFMIASNVGDDGDGMKTGLALVQMDAKARSDFANQVADEMLFALAAREKELHKDPNTVRMLRFQEMRTLAGLYLADASRNWDISDTAVKQYYEENPLEFMEAEAVKIKYLLLPDTLDANDIVAQAKSGLDLKSIAEKHALSGDSYGLNESEWMEKGLVKKDFETAFFASDKTGLVDPIPAANGTYLVEITARREPRKLSWEEARMEASQRLQRFLLKQEVETLRKKYPVNIDEKFLQQLGGAETAK